MKKAGRMNVLGPKGMRQMAILLGVGIAVGGLIPASGHQVHKGRFG